MALDDLLSKLESRAADTRDTPSNPPKVSAKPLQDRACTLDASDTPQNIRAEDRVLFNAWLFHFVDRDDLPVTFVPSIDHVRAMSYYPEAVAAEPIPDRPQRKPSKAEADEITALVNAVFPDDTDDDRTEALAAALADLDGALLCYRTIAEDRGIVIAETEDDRRTCSQCLNLRGRTCAMAKPGRLVSANPGYRPVIATLHRCAGYLPNTSDHDQRPGRERWPGL
jgi:hypothetical protein